MKKLLFLLFFIPFVSFAQQYSEVVEVSGKTSAQLYKAAREWFAVTFKSANDVLQMDDSAAGKLIGKGSTQISESYTTSGLIKVPILIIWHPSFVVNISLKDGKYKCEITDIEIDSQVYGSGFAPTKTSFSLLLIQKDYFKNGSDPEWIVKNVEGAKDLSKNMIKQTVLSNQAHYNLVIKTEDELKNIIASLREAINKYDDNW
jgi:hypothetical protein